MKQLLQPLLVAAAVGAGVFAGGMMKGSGDGGAAHSTYDSHGGDDSYAKDSHAKDGHGESSKDKGHGKKGSELTRSLDMNVSYLKFKRQVVIPVLGNDGVEALILLNIAIALDESAKDAMFNHEPKFRDAFIRELLQMSDAGYFNEALTSPSTYEAMRETLLRAARDVSAEGVNDVLILDFARQDR